MIPSATIFCASEFGNRLATDAKNNGNGFAMDAYLREAALADHPPSGTVYQPDGTRLASLGVHEHWNDAMHKQYSRNLSTNGTGIELVSLLAPNPTASANKDGVFNVKDFGATGDGKTLDTDAINQAIIAANAAGGGTVRFPAGTYLSASIRLKSNVTLQLEAGSTIEAVSEKAAPYDPPETNAWTPYQDFGHSHWHNSLIWGENIENVSIIGPGLIHGKGLQTWFISAVLPRHAARSPATRPSAWTTVTMSPFATFPFCMAARLPSWPPGWTT